MWLYRFFFADQLKELKRWNLYCFSNHHSFICKLFRCYHLCDALRNWSKCVCMFAPRIMLNSSPNLNIQAVKLTGGVISLLEPAIAMRSTLNVSVFVCVRAHCPCLFIMFIFTIVDNILWLLPILHCIRVLCIYFSVWIAIFWYAENSDASRHVFFPFSLPLSLFLPFKALGIYSDSLSFKIVYHL